MTTDRLWLAAMAEAGYISTKEYVNEHTPASIVQLKAEIVQLKFNIAERDARIAELEARFIGGN